MTTKRKTQGTTDAAWLAVYAAMGLNLPAEPTGLNRDLCPDHDGRLAEIVRS